MRPYRCLPAVKAHTRMGQKYQLPAKNVLHRPSRSEGSEALSAVLCIANGCTLLHTAERAANANNPVAVIKCAWVGITVLN